MNNIQAADAQFTTDTDTSKKNIHEVVVFIHGTILGLPTLFFNNLNFRFKEPYVFQPIDDFGFKEISLKNNKNLGTFLAAYNYQRIHETIYGKDRIFHFYTLGWNGHLKINSRKKASEELYHALVNLRDKIKIAENTDVEITLHGHSHGGNVIAYLKEFEKQYQEQLEINQVGLWGTPIQHETIFHFEDPMFKKIYHCYSEKDRVMTLDFISTKEHSAYRRFDTIYQPPLKVAQIELLVDKKHPSHAELWFLGCVSRFLYRKDFALFPFPCLHLAPAIFNAIDTLQMKNKDVILNIKNRNSAYHFDIAPQKQELQKTIRNQTFTYNIPHTEPLTSCGTEFLLEL